MFVQSAGCCDGSAPMCFPTASSSGHGDVLVGRVEGVPFYVDLRELDVGARRDHPRHRSGVRGRGLLGRGPGPALRRARPRLRPLSRSLPAAGADPPARRTSPRRWRGRARARRGGSSPRSSRRRAPRAAHQRPHGATFLSSMNADHPLGDDVRVAVGEDEEGVGVRRVGLEAQPAPHQLVGQGPAPRPPSRRWPAARRAAPPGPTARTASCRTASRPSAAARPRSSAATSSLQATAAPAIARQPLVEGDVDAVEQPGDLGGAAGRRTAATPTAGRRPRGRGTPSSRAASETRSAPPRSAAGRRPRAAAAELDRRRGPRPRGARAAPRPSRSPSPWSGSRNGTPAGAADRRSRGAAGGPGPGPPTPLRAAALAPDP